MMKNLILYIKSFLDRYIYLLPVLMLFATLYSNFFSINYVVMGNIVGYSIITNTISWYLFNCTSKKYCWFTRNAPVGLLIINIIDLIGLLMKRENYVTIFNVVVCSIIIILAVLFFIKKKLNDTTSNRY